MAGDIGITEAAIYVKPDEKASDTQLEQALRPTRARVIHRFGPRLAIAEVPEGGDVQATSRVERLGAALSPTPSDVPQEELDAVGALGLRALLLRETREYQEGKRHRERDGDL